MEIMKDFRNKVSYERPLSFLPSLFRKKASRLLPTVTNGISITYSSSPMADSVESLMNLLTVDPPVGYLTIYTQNIWFDKRRQKERFTAIINHVLEYLPDFVCLQECIPAFMNMLLENPKIREIYFISNNRMNWYGVNILSKWPCKFYDVPYTGNTFMSRSLLCAATVINGIPLVISTTHFESSDGPKGVELRLEQMRMAYGALAPHANVLIMGDFNYDADGDQEEEHRDASFVDLFDSAPNGTLSYTFIPRKDRLDRMLLKSKCWKSTSRYFNVGTDPLYGFSDHFGIMSLIEFNGNN